MKHSEQFTQVAAALAAAAADFGEIKRNREVTVRTRARGDRPAGEYTFKYATLDEIVKAVRPALSKNGLVLVQSVETEEVTVADASGTRIEREEMLETRLIHASGEWFANTTPVLIDAEAQTMQAYGSAASYARRYGITQLLCIVAEDDDDGNAASGNQVTRSRASGSSGSSDAVISDKQVGFLRARLTEVGGGEVALCGLLGVESLEAVPKKRMDEALKAISDKRPELFTASQPDSKDALKKRRHDEAAERLSESLYAIRYHLGFDRSDEIELLAVELGLGERNPDKAVKEWKAFSDADKTALWLAPSKQGWFSTQELAELRKRLSSTPTQQA